MKVEKSVIWNFLNHNKYWIVIVVGIVLVGFVDECSFMQLLRYKLRVEDLQEEISRYNEKYRADSKQLQELNRNPKAYERIARERYYMKAEDEDIYVFGNVGKTE